MNVDFLHPSFGRCPSATTGKFALQCDQDRAAMQGEIKRLSALVASLSADLEQSRYWRNFWCQQAKELSEKIASGLEGKP